MPSFGLYGDDVYATGPDRTLFWSGMDSLQPIRHLNAQRETERLTKLVLADREKRRRSAEALGVEFDRKLAEHKAGFVPKARGPNILERSMNSVIMSPMTAARVETGAPTTQASSYTPLPSSKLHSQSAPSLPKPQLFSSTPLPPSKPVLTPAPTAPMLISSTPLPSSKPELSFSAGSSSVLSPIPNLDNIPRFRDSLATPLQTIPQPTQTKDATKPPPSRSLHEALAKARLGTVEEEKGVDGIRKGDQQQLRPPTSTSVTPSSTRPSSPSENVAPAIPEEETVEEEDGEWSLSTAFYSDAIMELKSYLDDARMFEAKSGLTTRSLIKRSILEKVMVISKRHATEEEKKSTSDFFIRLLSMKEVAGFNNERFRLREKTSVHYAMNLIVERYLGLLERDAPLAPTISSILFSLSAHSSSSFSVFLTASLLSRSPFVDMDKKRCGTLVEGILAEPQSRQDVEDRERAACALFYGLHACSSKKPMKDAPFPLSSVWRIVACMLNRPPLLLATPFTLTEVLEACGSELQSRYGMQMEKLITVMQEQLLPRLERDLQNNLYSRRAGNAAKISSLRSTIDLLMIS